MMRQFKWLVALNVMNEIAFWSAHFSQNAERFAESMSNVGDYCYERMMNG